MKVTLPLFADSQLSIHLLSSIRDAPAILSSLKEADPRMDYCFLDARRVCSLNQIFCAAMRAMRDFEDGVARTKTLYSEVVYSMSVNQNISEALKAFGVAEDSEALYCLAINKVHSSHDRFDGISSHQDFDTKTIDGMEDELTEENILSHCDLELLKSVGSVFSKSLE